MLFCIVLSPIFVKDAYGVDTGAKSSLGSSIEAGADNIVNYKITGAKRAESSVYLFLQIEIRNSHGDLIGYIEGKPGVFNLDELMKWLEPQAQKRTIIKGVQHYELTQYTHIVTYSRFDSMSAYFLNEEINGAPVTIMFLDHDSVLMSPGDKAVVFWTVIRPSF